MTDKKSPDYDPALDASVPDADLDIDAYLRRQGHRAKAAIMGTAGVMKETALGKAKSAMPGGSSDDPVRRDPQGSASTAGSGPMNILRKHPWYAVGAATVAGFAGALYFNPTRYGRLRSKLKTLEKRLAEQEEKMNNAPAGGESKAQTAAKSSILSSLGTLVVTQGLNALKPLLAAYVEPLMAGRGHPSQNGHPPEYPQPEPAGDPSI